MRTIALTLLIGLLPLSNLIAQRVLSLQDAIDIALENNSTIKQSDYKAQMAKADYMQSAAAILPSIDFEMSGIHTTDPLASFGFKLKQEIVTQGDFNPALLNDPASMNHHSIKLQIQLPVFNLDAWNHRKAAKLGFEAMELQHTRTQEMISFRVKQLYFQSTLTIEVISVMQRTLKSAQASLELTKNNYEQGLLKEADVLLAKVHVEDVKNKLSEARNNAQDSKEALLNVLGIDLNEDIHLSDQISDFNNISLTEMNITDRSDVRAFAKGVEAKKKISEAKLFQFIPRINAFGSTEWNDNQAFGTNASNYTVGAMLSWKLFNGQKNIGSYKKAKVDFALSKENYDEYITNSQLELNKAIRDLELRYEQINTAKLNLEYARESKRMLKNRYEQGLEKTIDLLYAESLASNRELSLLQSRFAYQIQKYYLELITETKITNL